MNKILNCVNIETACRRAQRKLEKEARKNGLYENFGQEEIRAIKEKFIDSSDYSPEMISRRVEFDSFAVWCRNVSLNDL